MSRKINRSKIIEILENVPSSSECEFSDDSADDPTFVLDDNVLRVLESDFSETDDFDNEILIHLPCNARQIM